MKKTNVPPSEKKTPRSVASRLRVLVVEDEYMIAYHLQNMLTELGHEVVGPVGHVKEALHLVQQETLDAAVLDINIGGEDIFSVVKALDARRIPFIFVTGYDGKRLHNAYSERPILQKPFQKRDLQAVLRRLPSVKP